MPAMLDHAGVWTGRYTHISPTLEVIDSHSSRVECLFPDNGPHAYIQHNHFTWDDGREHRATLPGTFRDGRLWWDVEAFHGSAWQSRDGEILLHLHRRDEPGASFREIILLGGTDADGVTYRTRTWHWFKDGRLIRRTLCEERRLA